MNRIQTLNSIDDIIYQELPAADFAIASDTENPDAILVRSASLHGKELPENLKAIARAGAGTNNIPIEDCSAKGVVVFNTPGANANAVKEMVLTGLLLSGRKVVEAINWVQSLKGQDINLSAVVEKGKSNFAGHELGGKILGVVGLGAIGAQVANAAHYGMNMDVLGYDPFISVESAWRLSRHIRHAVTQEEIFTNCDYITLHVPLMDKTRGMLGEEQFAMMKDGVVILNFARGELVDNAALLRALESGKVRCYVTDFPAPELLGLDNVISIPHLGASTPESEQNCAQMAAAQLRDYLLNGNIRNSVNYPECALARSTDYRIALLHLNKTNMVSQMTAALAAEHVNIANMINKSRNAYAYTIFELDHQPSASCIEHLSAIEGVLKLRVL